MKTINFNDRELNILLYALQKLPWETADAILKNVVDQLKVQVEVEPQNVILTKE